MRLFGRRLLSLLAQEPLRRRKRPGAFAESNSLGREYGAAMADRGVPLVDTLEAFVFFRSNGARIRRLPALGPHIGTSRPGAGWRRRVLREPEREPDRLI